MTVRILAAFAALALAASIASAQMHDPRALDADPSSADGPIAPRLEGLGSHHFSVSTDSEESQAFFNQGIRLTYAFNHSEALRAFKEAARLDPDNAMAYWGWALALGPNINLPMVPEVVPQAWGALQLALAKKDGVSERERAYIDALAKRYSDDAEADRVLLDEEYAAAMAELASKYPGDLDARTLYGAALMNLSPWDYWYLDGSPKKDTDKILEAFSAVLEADPNHPGALHYYIHTVELPHPGRGEDAADRLLDLMPGAGHLVHMPSHIYMRIGRYADSYRANAAAVQADEGYIAQCRAQGIYPLGYYPHNLHFMAWSAMFQGRSREAIESARKVSTKIPEGLEGDGLALFETFMGQPIFTMVRFGRWGEMLAEPAPVADARFLTGTWHYGRALAHLHSDNRRDAKKELRRLEAIRSEVGTRDEYVIGFSTAEKLLTIAVLIVRAELDVDRGRFEDGIAQLARAVRIEDSLLYNEPPDWYFPVRHFLGAALLDAGRPAEAEVVYWQDLRKHPENGFALFGLERSLRAQNKLDLALDIGKRFTTAWSEADVTLTSSRF